MITANSSVKSDRAVSGGTAVAEAPEKDSSTSGLKPADHIRSLRAIRDRHVENVTQTVTKNSNDSGISVPKRANTIQAPECDINREAEEGLAAINRDIKLGDSWSSKSIEIFKRLFEEGAALPNASETSLFTHMKLWIGEINRANESQEVAIALSKELNIASFYVTLAKDKTAAARNHLSIASRRENPTAVRVGTFGS